MKELKKRWRALAAPLFEELARAYREPHRHYHNTRHIEALLHLSAQDADRLSRRGEVDFALFYHAFVYIPGRQDNESRSAEKAVEALRLLGADRETAACVHRLIMATQSHLLPPRATGDERYLVDFDLSILAAPQEAYEAYGRQGRREFAAMAEREFARGRSAFLQALLAQPQIFHTPEFRRREAQARRNMYWEIESLRHI